MKGIIMEKDVKQIKISLQDLLVPNSAQTHTLWGLQGQ